VARGPAGADSGLAARAAWKSRTGGSRAVRARPVPGPDCPRPPPPRRRVGIGPAGVALRREGPGRRGEGAGRRQVGTALRRANAGRPVTGSRRLRLQVPGLLALVADRQHGGQVGGRRRTRRRWRADPGGDGGRQLQPEGLPGGRLQIEVPAQVTARRLSVLIGKAGQFQLRGPAGQRRRHPGELRREGPARGRALVDHVRAREHIAKPLSPGRGDRGNQGDRAEDDSPDLEDPGQRSDQGLAEAHRAAVVGDHPQAHRHLAEGLAPAQGLEDRGVAHYHQHDHDDRDRTYRGVVQVPCGHADHDCQHDEGDDLDGHVDQAAGHPGRERGRRDIQHDGIPGHDLGHRNSPRFTCTDWFI
jgi:hypothetical protein